MNNFESFSEDNIPRNAPKPLNVYQASAIPSVPEVSLIFDKQCPDESVKKPSSKENELISYRKWCTQNNQLQQQFGKEYTPVGNLSMKTTTLSSPPPPVMSTKVKEQYHHSNVPSTTISSVLKLPNKSCDNFNNKPNQISNKNVQFLLSNDNVSSLPIQNNNNNNNKCAINCCEYPNKTILRSSHNDTKRYDPNNGETKTVSNYPTVIQMALQNNSQPQHFIQSELNPVNSTIGKSIENPKCGCILSNDHNHSNTTTNGIQFNAAAANVCIPSANTQPTISQLYDIIRQQQQQITNLQQNVEMILNICNNNNLLNRNCDRNNNNNNNNQLQNCIQLENNNNVNKIQEESPSAPTIITSTTTPIAKNDHNMDMDNDDAQLNQTKILQNIMKYMEMMAMNQQNNGQSSRPLMISNTIEGRQSQQQQPQQQQPNNQPIPQLISKPECVHQIEEKIITETSTQAATVTAASATAAASTTTKTTQCNIYRHSLIINNDDGNKPQIIFPQINNESKSQQQYQSNPSYRYQFNQPKPMENQQMFYNSQSQRNVYPFIRNNSEPCAGSGNGGGGDTIDKNTKFNPINDLNTQQTSSSSSSLTKRVTFDETSTKIPMTIDIGTETERSLAINALALEYLPKDMLNNIMNSNSNGYNTMRTAEQTGNGLPIVKADDLSMYQYLAKYGLIQKPQQQQQQFQPFALQNEQREQKQRQQQQREQQQQQIMMMFEESARQHVNSGRNPLEYDDNILDIHALKQQPKLL